MQSFGKQLTEARKAKGLTQEQLANLVNVSRPTVSHWESGRVEPDFDMLQQLSAVLECRFFEEEPSEAQAQELETITKPAPETIAETGAETVTALETVTKPVSETGLETVTALETVTETVTETIPETALAMATESVAKMSEETAEPASETLPASDQTEYIEPAAATELKREQHETAYDTPANGQTVPEAGQQKSGPFFKDKRHIFRAVQTVLLLICVVLLLKHLPEEASPKPEGVVRLQETATSTLVPSAGLSALNSDTASAEKSAEPSVTVSIESTVERSTVPSAVPSTTPFITVAPGASTSCVTITPKESPVKAVHHAAYTNGVGWFYTFTIQETAGIPFTITRMDMITVKDNGEEWTDTFLSDRFPDPWNGPVVTESSSKEVVGGFQLQDVQGVRLVLYGTDANGNQLSFEGYVELSKEIAD